MNLKVLQTKSGPFGFLARHCLGVLALVLGTLAATGAGAQSIEHLRK